MSFWRYKIIELTMHEAFTHTYAQELKEQGQGIEVTETDSTSHIDSIRICYNATQD